MDLKSLCVQHPPVQVRNMIDHIKSSYWTSISWQNDLYNYCTDPSTHAFLCADNFRLNHQGFTASVPHYHIQRYNNASQKLQAPTSTTSPQSTIPTGSAGTLWFVEQSASGSSQSGIRLYTTSGGTKWYLHAHPFSGSASVVREDHLSNVSDQKYCMSCGGWLSRV